MSGYGSSTGTRRWDLQIDERPRVRVIHAYVETLASPGTYRTVHPRGRGVDFAARASTPGRMPVHPRGRGTVGEFFFRIVVPSGSSTRARRRLGEPLEREPGIRFIHAYADGTSRGDAGAAADSVHPRACCMSQVLGLTFGRFIHASAQNVLPCRVTTDRRRTAHPRHCAATHPCRFVCLSDALDGNYGESSVTGFLP